MSLLDLIQNKDPATMQGLLQAGLSLLQSKGRLAPAIGQAGIMGLQGAQQFQDRQSAQQRAKLQEQLMQGQLGQVKRAEQMAALPGQFYRAPSMPGVDATGGMETSLQNPNNEANPQGRFDMSGYQNALMGLDPVQALQLQAMTAKQEPQLREFDPTKTYGTYVGGKLNPVLVGQPKPDLTSDQKDYAAAQAQGYKGSFIDYQREMANLKAPKTTITNAVNAGQKGYENESKLRNDFKSEPIYKDFQDMQQAHKQIKAGIAQGTPIGDVATATKMMKLLDPGSVVRESELGIAMAAGGRMDRLKNYIEMQMTGQKLTPQMRQEFGKLADELYNAAAQSYNTKRGEYERLGKRYELNTDVLGAPAGAGKVVNFGDLK